MDKLKNVLGSHGSRKDHGEGSHLEHARQGPDASTPATGGEQHHPIYDQFARTGPSTTGHGSATAPESAHYSSNLASSTHNSALRPDAFHDKPRHPYDENSTASIKSGVMGLPQGKQQTIPGRTGHSSNESTLAGTEVPPQGLHRQKDYHDLRTPHHSSTTSATAEKGSAQPFEPSFHEPVVATDTDRSFPLAGGVTSRIHDHTPDVSTAEREPGTKDRDLGAPHSHGREALAGAAAAYSTTGRHSEGTLSGEQRGVPGHYDETERSRHGGDALAGATSTYTVSSTGSKAESKSNQSVKFAGSPDPYDPCATDNAPPPSTTVTDGPHRTDTANRIDPHLHIPGEFPSTPMETPGEREQGMGSYVAGASRHPDSVATGTDSAFLSNKSDPQSQSYSNEHTGRNAAAAALGSYGAGKHHQRESTEVEGENMPASANPYSSKKVDPRVDSTVAGFDAQRFDPAGSTQLFPHATASEKATPSQSHSLGNTSQTEKEPIEKDHHYARNAGLAGAGAAAAGGAYYASQRDEKAASNVSTHDQGVAEAANPQMHQDPTLQSQHHGNRFIEDPSTKTTAPGAQYAADDYAGRRGTQPAASLENQRYDPSRSGAHDQSQGGDHHGKAAALAAGAGAGGLAYGASRHGDEVSPPADQHRQQARENYESPRSQGIASHDHDATRNPQHHYGRDAAKGTAGVGVAGYQAAARPGDDYSNPHQRYDSVQEPARNQATQPEPHDRNVPAQTNLAAGGVAVGAGAGAAYAYTQHDAQETEKQRLAQQKAQDKELEHQRKVQQKELEKQQKHEQKTHEKEVEHEHKAQQKELEKKEKEQQKAFVAQQKAIEREQEKEKKHHDKLVVAEAKAHQKEAEKKELAHEKEVDKENARLQKEKEKEDARLQKEREKQAGHEDGNEKKHHLFGFLHKDKKQSPERSPRTSKEYAGESRVSQDELGSRRSSNSHEGRNKLHKAPPPGHPASTALEQQKYEQAQADSARHPVQVPGNDTLHSGVYEAPNHHGKAEGENMEGYRNLTG